MMYHKPGALKVAKARGIADAANYDYGQRFREVPESVRK